MFHSSPHFHILIFRMNCKNVHYQLIFSHFLENKNFFNTSESTTLEDSQISYYKQKQHKTNELLLINHCYGRKKETKNNTTLLHGECPTKQIIINCKYFKQYIIIREIILTTKSIFYKLIIHLQLLITTDYKFVRQPV